jgi:hypothetical protein
LTAHNLICEHDAYDPNCEKLGDDRKYSNISGFQFITSSLYHFLSPLNRTTDSSGVRF